MGTINSYKDLLIWRKGIDIVINIYTMTESFPKEELFAVARQSIARNGADFILANDLNDIGENQHIGFLVSPTTELQANTKEDIAQLILDTLENGEQNG